MDSHEVLLDVKQLSLGFPVEGGYQTVVDRVSFQLKRGQTFALLGESGCGKTLTSLAITRLLPTQCVYMQGSQLLFLGEDLLALSERAMQKVRGLRIAMIFQETHDGT